MRKRIEYSGNFEQTLRAVEEYLAAGQPPGEETMRRLCEQEAAYAQPVTAPEVQPVLPVQVAKSDTTERWWHKLWPFNRKE